jgi:hypothetical protein
MKNLHTLILAKQRRIISDYNSEFAYIQWFRFGLDAQKGANYPEVLAFYRERTQGTK